MAIHEVHDEHGLTGWTRGVEPVHRWIRDAAPDNLAEDVRFRSNEVLKQSLVQLSDDLYDGLSNALASSKLT